MAVTRRVICFRTRTGAVGRQPVEPNADPLPVLTRLARLVPAPAEWWVEAETPRGAAIAESESVTA